MLRAEVTSTGDRLVIEGTIGTDAGIEAEGAARQVHGRAHPEAAHEALELLAVPVSSCGGQTV
jgi:hypothetical protein